MKSLFRVLSGSSLLAATMGMSAFGGLDEAAAFSQVNQRVAIILVGASGHDTVGGLMPLPLWPPARLHKEQCQRNHRGGGVRDFGRVACTDRRASSIGR
jgi:hypothetical protein